MLWQSVIAYLASITRPRHGLGSAKESELEIKVKPRGVGLAGFSHGFYMDAPIIVLLTYDRRRLFGRIRIATNRKPLA